MKYIEETDTSFVSFIGEEENVAATQIRSMELGFELPKNFLNPDKYRPTASFDEAFASVPDVVGSAIFDAMDADVPIDAFNPFIYLRHGRLPEFVAAYFMQLVSARVKSNMSRFFTAMHLIEMYREYIIIPPSHFMAQVDSVAVVRGEAKKEAGETEEGQEDKSGKVESEQEASSAKAKESSSVDKDDDDQPGSSSTTSTWRSNFTLYKVSCLLIFFLNYFNHPVFVVMKSLTKLFGFVFVTFYEKKVYQIYVCS